MHTTPSPPMPPCPLQTHPADVTVELEDIVDAVNVSRTVRNPWGTILRRRYRPQLVISIMIPIFQQWVGINAIIFYAPRKLYGSTAGLCWSGAALPCPLPCPALPPTPPAPCPAPASHPAPACLAGCQP